MMNDPYRDFCVHDAIEAEKAAKFPVCTECQEPIMDDDLYDINGELFCEECMKSLFRHSTDNYMKE